MKLFLNIIHYLVFFAVFITIVRMYLTVNKLWKRKHEKNVSESISIFAYSLAILVHLPYMIQFFFIDKRPMAGMNDAVNVIAYSMIILIGTGFWVRENKRVSFFKLLLKALRLERKESGDLLKSLVQPRGAKKILELLEKVSSLDDRITDEEVKLIKHFVEQWNVDLPDDYDFKAIRETSLMDIRLCLEDYLSISPPEDQAAELVDLIELVIKADSIVTLEEDIFLDEARKIVADYISGKDDATIYYVLIVPQSDEQWEVIKIMFPQSGFETWRGGKVLIVGKFYSKKFAEAICQKYISQGLFTIWDQLKHRQKAA